MDFSSLISNDLSVTRVQFNFVSWATIFISIYFEVTDLLYAVSIFYNWYRLFRISSAINKYIPFFTLYFSLVFHLLIFGFSHCTFLHDQNISKLLFQVQNWLWMVNSIRSKTSLKNIFDNILIRLNTWRKWIKFCSEYFQVFTCANMDVISF